MDPLLTHLSLVGSLVFFFATARFRERVLAARRPRMTPPPAAAYVKHMQDLLTHGLAAERHAPPAARHRLAAERHAPAVERRAARRRA